MAPPTIDPRRMRGEAAPDLPPPFTDILPSGQECDYRMPDPRKLIAFEGVVPDPLTAATITLLKRDRQYQDQLDPLRFRRDADEVDGLYLLAAEMLVWPKFDPRVEYGTGDTLGRRELGYMDLVWLYGQFRTGTRIITRSAAANGQPDVAPPTAPDSGDVRDIASPADGV